MLLVFGEKEAPSYHVKKAKDIKSYSPEISKVEVTLLESKMEFTHFDWVIIKYRNMNYTITTYVYFVIMIQKSK